MVVVTKPKYGLFFFNEPSDVTTIAEKRAKRRRDARQRELKLGEKLVVPKKVEPKVHPKAKNDGYEITPLTVIPTYRQRNQHSPYFSSDYSYI